MMLIAKRESEKRIKTTIDLMMEMNVNMIANASDITVSR